MEDVDNEDQSVCLGSASKGRPGLLSHLLRLFLCIAGGKSNSGSSWFPMASSKETRASPLGYCVQRVYSQRVLVSC